MVKKYRLGFARRMANLLILALLRAGVKIGTTSLLTVHGRKSGKLHTIPVTLVEQDNKRWLVAPYGAVSWVHNARAAGQVTLTRGRRSETVGLVELGAAEAAPILKQYLTELPTARPVQPFFDATPKSPLEAFEAEASRHPVFRILDAKAKL
jgi:deazaflavin-dependent oxidoreductase (nitroreductase family)